MVRLFLKFYGVLIATLVLSFMVQTWLIEYIWSRQASHYDFRVRFRPTYHLVETALAAEPRERWPDRFAAMAGGFGIAARMGPSRDLPEREAMKAEQRRSFDDGQMVAIETPSGFTVAKRLLDGDQAMTLDVPMPDNRKVKMVTFAANWGVEFTLVAILVWFWVRPFWREILGLRRAAEALGAGRFEARAQAGRGSPLRQVAEAFNAMARQVHSLLQSHRALTSAVSHELRTPIARLRFGHSLARESRDSVELDRLLVRMESDIDQLDALTSELLDYARLERGAPQLAWQSVPAAPWLEDVLAEVEGDPGPPVAIATTIKVAELRCEPRYMARALLNLVRNARRHARSAIHVTVDGAADRLRIAVDDDGPGIPAHDRDRLFEPFTRLDESRGRESGGFGLGLAIVRQVARWHGGDASIDASPLGGARVSIAW